MASTTPTQPIRCLGYIRVSTREQADSGLGLEAQRRALRAEAQRRGWDLDIVEDAGYSGRSDSRPGYVDVLARMKRGEADVLMVYKLDRVSRSVQHFAGLLHTATRQDWSLVALDMQVDMTTPNGRLVAHILVAVAQWEAEVIGARTKDAMAEARAKGRSFGGRASSPRLVSDAAIARMRELRSEGLSYSRIATTLEAEGMPTPKGGRWYAANVARLLKAEEAAA